MCETQKFREDPMSPSWCSAFAAETHQQWQQCEAEVRHGDTLQAFVDTDAWTALWDAGSKYATFNSSCHSEDPAHCPMTEELELSRAPAVAAAENATAAEDATVTALVHRKRKRRADPLPDLFVVTGTETGKREFNVDNGRLVSVVDGEPHPDVSATLNGRKEIVWSYGLTSRIEGGPQAGFGAEFITCTLAGQGAAPQCGDMCEGQTPDGPCPYLCTALSGCRGTCTVAGTDSRYDVQSCVNKCLARSVPLDAIPASPPCPAGAGGGANCTALPVKPPGGLSPLQAQALEHKLQALADHQQGVSEQLAQEELARDTLGNEFKDLLKSKILEHNPIEIEAIISNATANATQNGTNGTAPVAAVPEAAAAPVAPGAATPGTTPVPFLTPAAQTAMDALKDDIASTTAQIGSVQQEQAAYRAQIDALSAVR